MGFARHLGAQFSKQPGRPARFFGIACHFNPGVGEFQRGLQSIAFVGAGLFLGRGKFGRAGVFQDLQCVLRVGQAGKACRSEKHYGVLDFFAPKA